MNELNPTPENTFGVIHRPGKIKVNDYEMDNNRFDYVGIRQDMASQAIEVYFRDMINNFDETVAIMIERGFKVTMNQQEVGKNVIALYNTHLDQQIAKQTDDFDKGLDELLS